MVEVTVEQFAKVLKISADRLVMQLESAGIPDKKSADIVTDEEKRKLLIFLRKSHGASDDKSSTNILPKKTTLKRKTTATLQQKITGARSATAHGVNVEIRKKKNAVIPQKTAVGDAVAAKSQSKIEKLRQLKEQRVREEKQREEIEQERIRIQANKKVAEEQAQAAKLKQEEDERKQQKLSIEKKRIESEQAQRVAKEKKTTPDKTTKTTKTTKATKSAKEATLYGRKELHVAKPGKTTRKRKKTKTPAIKHKRVELSAGAEHAFTKPTEPVIHEVQIPESITVGELAQKMSVKAGDLLKVMMNNGIMATINQSIDYETAFILVEEMGHKPVAAVETSLEDELLLDEEITDDEMVTRAPVVTIMGHVDHGKTSLLDYIRNSQVTKGEAGGITQHIGAYKVDTDYGEITFLDTPGHAAFSAMRARGASVTDIVIVLIAADDGVMPQTLEAIQHARAANAPMIVAVNKIDKEDADLDRVKNEMSSNEVVPEDWGGNVQFVPISAKTGVGIDDLLETISLVSELLELKAYDHVAARGIVIESRVDKGRGAIATILVQSGTLKKGDVLIAGREYGKVRNMMNEYGQIVTSGGPSTPVEILGLSGCPEAGDEAVVVDRERKARELVSHRISKHRDLKLAQQKQASLDLMFDKMKEGELDEVNILVKADVHGSAEAIRESLEKLSNDEVKVKVIAAGVGGINESDVNLAIASNAILLGFNVRADASAKRLANSEGVTLEYYSIIYDLIDQIKNLVVGKMATVFKDEIIGIAEVRDVFKASKLGAIAGCIVTEGVIKRHSPIRVLRDSIVIYEGELESLRRFKDNVNEVRSGTECGIGVKNYNDIKAGDNIEVYERVEVKRTV